MEKALKILSVIKLGIFLFCTATLFAQTRPSQETRDAIQDQRLAQIETTQSTNGANISKLTTELSDLTASMNRFTGIGIGIGCTLTVLQALQVVLQLRNNKSTP